jgi:hypothetical protein
MWGGFMSGGVGDFGTTTSAAHCNPSLCNFSSDVCSSDVRALRGAGPR